MKASKTDLRTLILENKGQLSAVTKDSITVKVNGDEWLLVKGPDENELYHNNYKVLPDYSREITPGYHQHLYQPHPRIGFLIKQICQYSWKKHIELFRQKEFEGAVQRTSRKVKQVLMWEYADQSKVLYTYIKLLDCNGIARKFLRQAGVGFQLIKAETKHDEQSALSCELITIRVRREDVHAFHQAIRPFRSYIISNAFERYADQCKKYINQSYVVYQEPKKSLKNRIILFVADRLKRCSKKES